jgi:hypothetical protein
MNAYDILLTRGVTRLCHFTKLQSLTHIVSSAEGILATASIRQDTKNVIDTARYDVEMDYVCCSVEYPNSWFLDSAINRNTDKIFRDWVVLYVDLYVLKEKDTKFCRCNAAIGHGQYITSDINEIFTNPVSYMVRDTRRVFCRNPDMLDCCPTDGQAEIMIKDSIPRGYINGIAVGNEEVAERVYAMLKEYEINSISIYIAPDIMIPAWSNMIKSGTRPVETKYHWPEED